MGQETGKDQPKQPDQSTRPKQDGKSQQAKGEAFTTDFVQAIAFLPDGKKAVVCTYRHYAEKGMESGLYLWDLNGQAGPYTFYGMVTTIASNGGRTGRHKKHPQAHAGKITAIAVSPDGRHLASAGADGLIKIWDLSTKDWVREWHTNHKHGVRCLTFFPDGKRLATGGSDKGLGFWNSGEVTIWDVAESTSIRRFVTKSLPTGLGVSKDGKYLLAGCGTSGGAKVDTRLWVWEAATGKLDHSTPTKQQIYSFSVARDTPICVAGMPTSLVWDFEKRARVRDVSLSLGAYGSITSLSPDGKWLLAVAPDERTIQVIETATGRLHCELKGHRWRVLAIAVSPDSKYALSGSNVPTAATPFPADSSPRYWDLESGRQIFFQGKSKGLE